MATDVGQEFDAARVAHKRLGVTQPFETVLVADVRHHEFMADVFRTGVKQPTLFDFVDRGIEVPVNGELRSGAAEDSDGGKV